MMYWVLMVLNTDDGVVRLQAQYRDVTIHWASNQDVWCKKTSINEPSWCALHLQVSTSSWVEIVVFQNKPWSTIDSMHYCKLIYIKKKREKEITAIFTLLFFSCKLSCWEKLLFRFFSLYGFICMLWSIAAKNSSAPMKPYKAIAFPSNMSTRLTRRLLGIPISTCQYPENIVDHISTEFCLTR